MVEQTFTLVNATGLHARPAAVFVQTVNQFAGTQVWVQKGERKVNARSLLGILSLGAGQGSTITVTCEGPRADEAMAALARLLESGFGE